MILTTKFIDKIDLRSRLRSLSFYTRSCFSEYKETFTPIYTESELAIEPLKWLKYLLLDRSGVESIDRIKEQIHRFSIEDIEAAEIWVQQRMDFAEKERNSVCIVCKLVPWDQGAQLKNFRIHSIEDVGNAFTEIRHDLQKGAHELWCCESEMGISGLNLGGRLNYPLDCGTQTIELVWYTSPRSIENIGREGFEYPYIRAVRSTVNPEFSVSSIYVPNQYQIGEKFDSWYDDFNSVLWLINSRQPSMQRLVDILHNFGANEVCFCFKVTDGQLTIIDWDTEIESSDVLK